jgi:hypothetical protein
MPIYYTGTDFRNRVKQYEGINPRGLFIDFKDAEGKIYKNARNAGQMNWAYLKNANPYCCKYYEKGKKITFELNPGQFPFVE